jgi:hypothetical protein
MKPENVPSRLPQVAQGSEARLFRTRFLLTGFAVALSALLAPVSLAAQAPKPSEFQVKAAYIYNFGKFVRWPANSPASQDNSFAICVLGDDPFGSVLQSALAGETLGGRPVSVKRIAKAQDAKGCRILSIAAREEGRLRGILGALDQASVLTVSDIPDFAKHGGMIEFVLDGGKVRFEINRRIAEDSGLTLPSELLKVALAVRGAGRPGGQ